LDAEGQSSMCSRSSFDIRHYFVANVIYELSVGRGTYLGGWQVSGVTNGHSNLPFTPVLSFDNADLQSLLVGERPDLVGNPYTGVCPNGNKDAMGHLADNVGRLLTTVGTGRQIQLTARFIF
jgi:hypothetical protein